MAYTVKERVETTSIPYAPRQSPCFEERKAPYFSIDTLCALAIDLSHDTRVLPYTLEIPMNGMRFVFHQANPFGSRLYYLAYVKK